MKRKINITIEYDSIEEIENELLDVRKGTTIQLDDGVLVEITRSHGMSFNGGEVLELLLSFSKNVAAGLVANAIYDKFCKGASRIEINGHRVKLQEDSIAKIIETIKGSFSGKSKESENENSSNKRENV